MSSGCGACCKNTSSYPLMEKQRPFSLKAEFIKMNYIGLNPFSLKLMVKLQLM